MVIGDHLLDGRHVAAGQPVDGLDDLLFDDAPHVQHARAHPFQFRIELLRNMFGHG
jgi:hypothetical protein